MKHYELKQGGCYKDTYGKAVIILRLNTPTIYDRGSCDFINLSTRYYGKNEQCSTAAVCTFVDATPEEIEWLNLCIEHGEYLEKPLPRQIVNNYEIY